MILDQDCGGVKRNRPLPERGLGFGGGGGGQAEPDGVTPERMVKVYSAQGVHDAMSVFVFMGKMSNAASAIYPLCASLSFLPAFYFLLSFPDPLLSLP